MLSSNRWELPGTKLLQARIGDESIQRLEGEHFSACGEKQLFHILSAHPKTASGNTGNNLVFGRVRRLSLKTQGSEVLNPSDFVTGRTVVFGDLGLDNDLRVIFIRDDEVRSLVEAWNLLGPFGLAVADSRAVQNLCNFGLKDIADQIGH